MLVHQRVNHPHFCSMSATNSHLTDDTRTTPAAFLTFALPWKVTWRGSSSRKMSHKTKHNGDIIGIYSNSKSCKLVPGLFPKLRKKTTSPMVQVLGLLLMDIRLDGFRNYRLESTTLCASWIQQGNKQCQLWKGTSSLNSTRDFLWPLQLAYLAPNICGLC